ncbi:hypothetical protein [Nocardioides montaniterrae]
MEARSGYTVDFPTLWIVPAWHERHCIIPDGFRKGTPWRHYDWQLWVTVNHYRVKPGVEPFDDEGYPTRAAAFENRRTQVIDAQKKGKGPFAAVITCGEAVGPVLFCGWAEGGEFYRCSDHGCHCGWSYTYEPGEPMGMPWPTPLIQLLATSQDQVDNVWRPLQAMARGPYLSGLMRVGEEFIRLPNEGRIDAVTSSALSRLGNPITFALQDETQLYTEQNKMVRVAETMRRGLAGMGGRSMETTNCYDPSEKSVAQRTHESRAKDVFKFYEPPPPKLNWSVKAERRQIVEMVYADSPHVNISAILAEAEEIGENDPAQAERFFGNRIVSGTDAWCSVSKWNALTEPREVGPGTQIVVGFDGSDTDDWTGFRCETRDGYQFTPKFPDGRPMIWDPAKTNGQVPRVEVDAGLAHIMDRWNVARMYGDPPYWESEMDAWAEKYGEKVVIRWYTRRIPQMHSAAERLLTDIGKAGTEFAHDDCQTTALHVSAARRSHRPGGRYVLAKPGDGRKIDMAIPSILAHEACGDVTAAGWPELTTQTYFRLPR